MKIKKVALFCTLLLCLLFVTIVPVSSVAPNQASQENLPAIGLSALHPNVFFLSPSIYPETPFPEYLELEILVLHDTSITDERRVELLKAIEEKYAEKKEAYYASIPDTKIMRHTFDCGTDTSYHEITLVYTKKEILRFETTTLRAGKNVSLSFSNDSPTEATVSVFVENLQNDLKATVTFKLLESGELIVRSSGVKIP